MSRQLLRLRPLLASTTAPSSAPQSVSLRLLFASDLQVASPVAEVSCHGLVRRSSAHNSLHFDSLIEFYIFRNTSFHKNQFSLQIDSFQWLLWMRKGDSPTHSPISERIAIPTFKCDFVWKGQAFGRRNMVASSSRSFAASAAEPQREEEDRLSEEKHHLPGTGFELTPAALKDKIGEEYYVMTSPVRGQDPWNLTPLPVRGATLPERRFGRCTLATTSSRSSRGPRGPGPCTSALVTPRCGCFESVSTR